MSKHGETVEAAQLAVTGKEAGVVEVEVAVAAAGKEAEVVEVAVEFDFSSSLFSLLSAAAATATVYKDMMGV